MSRTKQLSPSRLRPAAALLAAVCLASLARDAGAQDLRRNLSSYLLLTMKRASLKNMRIGSPCNVGVNCASPAENSKCGVLALGRVTAVDGGQVVASQTFLRKPGAQLWQLFRNNDSSLENVTLLAPQPNPQPFDGPVIPGTCDAACNPNYAAMKQACGFPDPVPGLRSGEVGEGRARHRLRAVRHGARQPAVRPADGHLRHDRRQRRRTPEPHHRRVRRLPVPRRTGRHRHGRQHHRVRARRRSVQERGADQQRVGAGRRLRRSTLPGRREDQGVLRSERRGRGRGVRPAVEDLAGPQQHPDRQLRRRHHQRRSEQLRPLLRWHVLVLRSARPVGRVGRRGRHRHRQLSRRDGERRPGVRILGDRGLAHAGPGAVRGAGAGGRARAPSSS